MLPIADIDTQIRSWTSALGMPWDGMLRLLLAAAAGGCIGYEREIRGRQAGLRTNILMCVGSAVVMIVSNAFAQRAWVHDPSFNVAVDPARLAYGVMAGVGLLCAGSIIKEWGRVSGLTTAAGLWCATALGLAAGFGLYVFTIGATILILLVLWLLQYVEQYLPRIRYVTVTLSRTWSPDCVAESIATLSRAKFRVSDVDFRRTADLKSVHIHLKVGFISRESFYAIAKKIEADPNVEMIAAKDL